MMNKKWEKEKYHGKYFLGSVILLHLLLFLFRPEGIKRSLMASGSLLIKIIPILLLVLFFMGIMDYFMDINPESVSKYTGKGSGTKGWILAISSGILSHGPIYLWYPLLKELQGHGMRSGLVAAFLYNRGIKIPLLPLMIYYFGALYVAVLSIIMIIASIVEGKIIEMIET